MPVRTPWTPHTGYRSPRASTSTVKIARKARVRRRVIWSRILLPLLAMACVAAYQGNSGLEKQYQNDQLTIYSQLSR